MKECEHDVKQQNYTFKQLYPFITAEKDEKSGEFYNIKEYATVIIIGEDGEEYSVTGEIILRKNITV